jgi:predicted ATPase/DNA-binding CsgD family transcriptional regulator
MWKEFPQQSTPIIGRQQEVAVIQHKMADPACRLLTLIGPGGIGKTRLALQCAAAMEDRFRDGRVFVPLQSVPSTDALLPAIASALHLQLTGNQAVAEQIAAHLRQREMLLLLDNVDHLVAGADMIADLLRGTLSLRLLVTSREALNLSEEWLFPVNGLPYPAEHEETDLAEYAAVQIFVNCARRLRPDLSLEEEGTDVRRICRLVEGSPLALELAASWVRTMRCAEIASEIERNTDFLTTRLRDMPLAHRSMRAVFEQSWNLLSDHEQDVYRRLSIFRGGFRRHAAEQVANASLLTLTALVDKSLLRWAPDGRYASHELLRQYAAEQLSHADQVDEARARHGRYYTDLLATVGKALRGGRQREAQFEIAADLRNMEAAWHWAIDHLHVDVLFKAGDSLYIFYDQRGRYVEGVGVYEAALERLRAAPETPQILATWAMLANNLSGLYIRLGRLDEAEAVTRESQMLYERLDMAPPPTYASDPVFLLGLLATIRGDYIEAERLGEQARANSEAQGNLSNQQMAFYLLGRAALLRGDAEQARLYIERSHLLTHETEDHWFMAYCLIELGNIACAQGDLNAARDHFRGSLEIRRDFEDPEGMAVALNHLGQVALRQSNTAEARRHFEKALTLSREISNRGSEADALHGLGRSALADENSTVAREHFREALEVARGSRFVPLLLALLADIGALLATEGKMAMASEVLALASDHPGSEPDTQARARVTLEHFGLRGKREAGTQDAPPPWSTLEAVAVRTEAILRGRRGSQTRSRHDTSDIASDPSSDQASLAEPLTAREQEVLRLLDEGLSNPEIAERLVLAIGTVKYYTSQIYGKLGVRGRVHALTSARKLGLL